MCDISPKEQSNIFGIFMTVIPVFQSTLLNSDISLMLQVREPIWNHSILNCSSFVPRNCDTEFSQTLTGTIFNSLSHEERLFFKHLFL